MNVWTKPLLLLVSFVLMALPIKAQIATNSWHDGYWGKWVSHNHPFSMPYPGISYDYSLYGNYSGFVIFRKDAHPSEFFFKFQANSYSQPDKKTKRYHLKHNLWYEYSGTVEYYVTEEYPTIADVLKKYNFPFFDCTYDKKGKPCVKRTANAVIKIAPYKKKPKCYNIYFDSVAVGIDMLDSYF